MWHSSYLCKRSKDPNTQVGACIVNEDKKIVGVGYNGLPLDVVMKFFRGREREIFGYKVSLCLPCRIKCNFK